MNRYTFIVTTSNMRMQWSCIAKNEDSAWELVNMEFPGARYIELF